MRLILALLLLCGVAYARDPEGKYKDSPFKGWFESLRNGNNEPCCDIADGRRIDDVDWESKDGHYRVRVDGQWYDVPDAAVVKTPNRYGPAVVWPYAAGGRIWIRCFIPGAGT